MLFILRARARWRSVSCGVMHDHFFDDLLAWWDATAYIRRAHVQLLPESTVSQIVRYNQIWNKSDRAQPRTLGTYAICLQGLLSGVIRESQ